VTGPTTVAEAGERALIARVRDAVPTSPAWVRLGIGDDAALVEPVTRALDVITTDALVEGVHFDRAFVAPGDIGAKALAVNLSDLAAMGATPRVAVVSFGLPGTLALGDYDALVAGLADVARRFGVAIVGGNITRSPGPLFVDVTLTGAVHARKALTRSGARPGDELYVTGRPGGAAAGLELLQRRCRAGEPVEEWPSDDLLEAVTRYRRPEPRVRLGVLVGRNRAASACMDTSDGLADAVRQVAEASGTGAVIDAASVPWHPATDAAWPEPDERVARALAGGDDYELLFAVPPRRRRAFAALARRQDGVAVTRIGRLTADHQVVVERAGTAVALPAGFAHFG
jgi:thiamine-monophosphate kinase